MLNSKGPLVTFVGILKSPFTFQQVKHIRDINHFLFWIKRGRVTAEAPAEEMGKEGREGVGSCRQRKHVSAPVFFSITVSVGQVWTEAALCGL